MLTYDAVQKGSAFQQTDSAKVAVHIIAYFDATLKENIRKIGKVFCKQQNKLEHNGSAMVDLSLMQPYKLPN